MQAKVMRGTVEPQETKLILTQDTVQQLMDLSSGPNSGISRKHCIISACLGMVVGIILGILPFVYFYVFR